MVSIFILPELLWPTLLGQQFLYIFFIQIPIYMNNSQFHIKWPYHISTSTLRGFLRHICDCSYMLCSWLWTTEIYTWTTERYTIIKWASFTCYKFYIYPDVFFIQMENQLLHQRNALILDCYIHLIIYSICSIYTIVKSHNWWYISLAQTNSSCHRKYIHYYNVHYI